MSNNADSWFGDIDEIIIDPLKFKAKLDIGENAYRSLRAKNTLSEVWDVAGVASTAVAIARSGIVASKFFAPKGFLAALGFGTAVTPIGWVIAAGLISGGAWMGITRYIKSSTDERIKTIPNFINTPLDVLALSLFDLYAPLAMKIAAIDEDIDPDEIRIISAHFIRGWGYDPVFVEKGLAYVEKKLSSFSVQSLAETLAEFQKENPDCNFKTMSKEILMFLQDIAEADGRLDERETMAIERVESAFKKASKLNFTLEKYTNFDFILRD